MNPFLPHSIPHKISCNLSRLFPLYGVEAGGLPAKVAWPNEANMDNARREIQCAAMSAGLVRQLNNASKNRSNVKQNVQNNNNSSVIIDTRPLSLALLVLAGLCGCGTPDHLPEYTSASTPAAAGGGTVKTAESEGIIVSLEPFADKARCEKYFALDAPAAGIAILHLRLENRSPDTTWLLRKTQCKLLLPGRDSSLGAADTAQSTTAGEAMAAPGGLLLIGLGSHQVKQATTVQRNFTEKELRDKTLAPGQVTEGFVYYHMPQKNASFQGTLQVSLVNTGNQHTNTLQIPIDYEVK